jgi:hypothetical protein
MVVKLSNIQTEKVISIKKLVIYVGFVKDGLRYVMFG